MREETVELLMSILKLYNILKIFNQLYYETGKVLMLKLLDNQATPA